MPSLAQQQEERRRERREREREEQRRAERLEQQREQAREAEREREREEQARQEALEQARRYEAEDARRRERHQRALQRVRAERRERAQDAERQHGRLAAVREATAAARRAAREAEESTQRRQEQRRQQERAARRQERDARPAAAGNQDPARGRAAARTQAREQEREEARQQARSAARREAQRQARREREREAALRGEGDAGRGAAAREQRTETRRSQQRAQRRAEEQRQQQLTERREGARSARQQERREEERAAQRDQDRAAARAAERSAQRARDLAAERRRENASRDRRPQRSAAAASLTALRVHGPLLLDESDRPVRLRGVRLPALDSPRRQRDGSIAPAVAARDLDEVARWGATLVALPVGLEEVLEVPPPAPGPFAVLPHGAQPPGDTAEAAYRATPDEGVLEILDAAIAAAAERGLYALVQLTPLRRDGDDSGVDFAWLRQFWRVIGRRYAGTPTALFDLLQGPPGSGVSGSRHPASGPASSQRRSVALALLGELRREHPAAVVVVEEPEGTVPLSPIAYTDGSPVPGVITAVRSVEGGGPADLPALAALARRAPVIAVGWGGPPGAGPNDAVGRRLASVGVHWVADGWPRAGSLPEPGRLLPTAAGAAVAAAAAVPDRPVGQDRRDAQPADLWQSAGPAGGLPAGAGGLPGRLLAQLVLAAAAPTPPLPEVIAPRGLVADYLPTRQSLRVALRSASAAERATVLAELTGRVRTRWAEAQHAGLVDLLGRVRPAERDARAAAPAVPGRLREVRPSAIVPTYLREHLLVDVPGASGLGRSLVLGEVDPADLAGDATSAAQAVMGLRALDDVLSRAQAARRAADETGADLALVLALYRTEGDLAMPPSAQSLAEGIPSGTVGAATFLTPRPEISTLVWLADVGALGGRSEADVAHLATWQFVLQVAGLDLVAGASLEDYQRWSLQTWRSAEGTGGPVTPADEAATAARARVLATGLNLRRGGPGGAQAYAAALLDPVAFVATVLSDGVQLLRSLRRPDGLFEPPSAGPQILPVSLAYLRYNLGDDQTKLLLASAARAAAGTRGRRWEALRGILAGHPGTVAKVTAALRAAGTPGTAAEKAVAAGQVWPALQEWCAEEARLLELLAFVERADDTEWSSGWMAARANLARFRTLLDYYERLATAH